MESDPELIVKELMHLDMPLSVVELQYAEESAKKIPWTPNEFPFAPYIFYKRQNSLTYLYYDPRGVEWQKSEAAKYSDPSKAISEIDGHFSKIEKIIKGERALRRDELAGFLKTVREFWQWLDYMWWAIEAAEEKGEPYDALMAARKRTEYFIPGIIAVLRNTAKALYPEKAEYADLILLSEIEDDAVPGIDVLKSRAASCAYTDHKLWGSWDEIVGKYGLKIADDNGGGNGLRGSTAYPGTAKGKVRIVATREDVAAFRTGEIIVSSTTTPDFMPAIAKAAAIISEHGGVICHAAIVSRELKIPCVVGVRGATKALKTGDIVEVDAAAGTVSIAG